MQCAHFRVYSVGTYNLIDLKDFIGFLEYTNCFLEDRYVVLTDDTYIVTLLICINVVLDLKKR
jgi:hypothetical protein